MTGSVRITAEDSEIVTLAKAKAHCRVDISDDDDLLTRMITTARRNAEAYTRRALVGKTFEYSLDYWPCSRVWEIPMPPLRSITGVTYTDDDAVSAVWASSEYTVDTRSEPGRMALSSSSGSFPSGTLQSIGGIVIAGTAGYIYPPGSPTVYLSLPEDIENAILMAVDRFYEHRGDDLDFTDQSVTARFLPPNFYHLLSRYRSLRI